MNEAEQRRVLAAIAPAAQHDVNNLLTIVLATLELMRRDVPDGDKAVRRIDRTESAARRLEGLLRGFFTLARAGDGACDGALLLHRLAPVLRLAMAQPEQLAIDVPEEGVAIIADSAALSARLMEALRDQQTATLRLGADAVEITLGDGAVRRIAFAG